MARWFRTSNILALLAILAVEQGCAQLGGVPFGFWKQSSPAGPVLDDTTRPAPIADLTGTPSTSAVNLTWTAVGDDSVSGSAYSYDIRYSTTALATDNVVINSSFDSTDAGWDSLEVTSAVRVTDTVHTAPGACLVTASGVWGSIGWRYLAPGRTDTVFASAWVYMTTADTMTIEFTNENGGTFKDYKRFVPTVNTWTELKDTLVLPGTQTHVNIWIQLSDAPTATRFFVDDVSMQLSGLAWASATAITNEPIPGASGASESNLISGLAASTTYWFGAKVSDEDGNYSRLVSVARAITTSPDVPGGFVQGTSADKFAAYNGSSLLGTYEDPWSIATMNDSLGSRAGLDTVRLKGGVYTTQIKPKHSGTLSQPLVIAPYGAEVCSVYTTTGPGLHLYAVNHVIVEGLAFQLLNGVVSHPVEIDSADYSAVMYCRIYGGTTLDAATSTYHSVPINRTDYFRFIGNLVDRQDPFTTNGNGWDVKPDYRGDGIALYGGLNSRFNIIEGNTVKNVSHFGIAVPYGQGTGAIVTGRGMNVIRKNTVFDSHVCVGQTDYNELALVEDNKAYSPGQKADRGGLTYEQTTVGSIIRFNKFADDSSSIAGAYRAPGGNNASLNQSYHARNNKNRIYHNAFLGKSSTPAQRYATYNINNLGDDWEFGKNVWVNNIMAYPNTGYNSHVWFWQNDHGAMNDTLRGNLVWAHGVGDTIVSHGDATYYTLSGAKSAMPNNWASTNFEATPKWVDSLSLRGARNYALASGSPCIDVGVELTTTTSTTTNSKIIQVSDAGYFAYDWGGNPWLRGDSLMLVLGATTVNIELDSVDYDNHRLISKENVTIGSGAKVYVKATWSSQTMSYVRRLYGSVPDVGPYEYVQ